MQKLWYKKPARVWREALPIGNGITGAMVFGGKKVETLAFNDVTLWSGYPKDQNNLDSLQNLPKVRELIFKGENCEADKLTMEKLCGGYSESYMPLGNLNIAFKGLFFGAYKRELDVSSAVHTTTFSDSRREVFASYPDKVVVYRIRSAKPQTFTITATSKLPYEVAVDKNTFVLSGNAPDYVAPQYLHSEKDPIHYEEGKGMSFGLFVNAQSDGSLEQTATSLTIKNAKTTTLYITTATGFNGYDKMPSTDRKVAINKCKKAISLVNMDYEKIKSNHIKDYQDIYLRQTLDLKSESEATSSMLVKQAKIGKVKIAYAQLLYNYGKYLMIAGSRIGGEALNLQGLWNESIRPPWSSNYTVNINTQMNYWAASNSNMAECVEPLIKLAYEILDTGAKTAKVNYDCDGACANHNIDIWRKTSPVIGDPHFMYAPLCGAWIANEVYEHYRNGKLTKYRDKVYAIVTENAKFASSYLVEHDGYLVTCPSASPELQFNTPKGGANLDYASTFEMSVIRQCFANYIEIAKTGELLDTIKAQIPKLYPYGEGETGLLEWHKYYSVSDKGHRHFSPLYGFYPARQIKYYQNPKEVALVNKLFNYRTDNSHSFIGWSAAWAICLSGRLHNSEKATKVIKAMLSHSVFSNLFTVHPPFLFQIDGNFGFVAGINELLVYQEDGVVDLLPALPEEWKDGAVKGFVICGGASVSFKWLNNKVTSISSDKPIVVRNINIEKNATLRNVTLLSE